MFPWRTSDRFAPCLDSYSFVVSDALRGRTTAAGYNAPMTHFRNRRCLAKCRRRLGRAFALKPAEEASSIAFPIGRRGSRHQRPLPDRPPTFQAFRSVLSRARHSPLARLSPRPFGLGPQSKAFQRLPIGFNPTAFKAPVRTSVATVFNSGEH